MDVLELLIVVPASLRLLYGLSVVFVPLGISMLVMAVLTARSSDRPRTLRRCLIPLVPMVMYALAVLFWPLQNMRMEDASMMVFIGIAILLSPPSILLISIVGTLIYAVAKGIRAIMGK